MCCFLRKVMHYITFELLFVTWAGLAYLFLITENTKVIFLARPFHTKSEMNKPQADENAFSSPLTPNFS